jgi:hypothetical protein
MRTRYDFLRDALREVQRMCRPSDDATWRTLFGAICEGDPAEPPRAADHDERAGLETMRGAAIALEMFIRSRPRPEHLDRGALLRRLGREYPSGQWSDAAIARAVDLGRQVRDAFLVPITP